MFEVEDLSQASPATVSRAGMIFLTLEDLGWWPYAESWIERRTAQGTHQVSVVNFSENLSSLELTIKTPRQTLGELA